MIGIGLGGRAPGGSGRTASVNGWQRPLIGALWGVLLILIGVVWAENQQTQRAQQQQIRELEAGKVDNGERIATLEEAVRGIQKTLERIEAGVNDLRRQERRGR